MASSFRGRARHVARDPDLHALNTLAPRHALRARWAVASLVSLGYGWSVWITPLDCECHIHACLVRYPVPHGAMFRCLSLWRVIVASIPQPCGVNACLTSTSELREECPSAPRPGTCKHRRGKYDPSSRAKSIAIQWIFRSKIRAQVMRPSSCM